MSLLDNLFHRNGYNRMNTAEYVQGAAKSWYGAGVTDEDMEHVRAICAPSHAMQTCMTSDGYANVCQHCGHTEALVSGEW
jgi:hypothetical protein